MKFAMSYWHTIDQEGTDVFGGPTMDKKFGKTDPLEIFKAKADFAFELMDALGMEYYCFHDVDIAPEGKTLKESLAYFYEMVDYIYDLQKKHNKKLLWAILIILFSQMRVRNLWVSLARLWECTWAIFRRVKRKRYLRISNTYRNKENDI